jgi:hypothetical protein
MSSFISYCDDSVLGFLQEFHRNSLFTNVNLDLFDNKVYRESKRISSLMIQLLPSITSIESVKPLIYCMALLKEKNSDMLSSARILFD